MLRLRAQCVFVRPRTNVRPARRSLLKEAGIATSLGVVVAARRRRVVEVASSERHRPNCHHTQVAYFGWYQMHAKVQTNKIKEYYEQNPTTGEEIGQ